MKGEVRAAKRASSGKIEREGLSDITNSPLAASKIPSEHPELLLFPLEITEGYADKLIQENRTLMKLIEERNKIIALSGAELERLRITYQKTQLQNWNLAQSNSQMLAELNLARDKLKALRHELACKEALLRAKKLEVEGKMGDKHDVKNCSTEAEGKEVKELFHKATDKRKPPGCNRRHHQRSQSMGVPSTNKHIPEKEKAEKKRRCPRRQSARFVSQESEPAENMFEIEETKFPVSQPLKSGPGSSDPSSAEEDKQDSAPSRAGELEARKRSSIGRPLRRAAEKVLSYKEPPLNIKMRRVE